MMNSAIPNRDFTQPLNTIICIAACFPNNDKQTKSIPYKRPARINFKFLGQIILAIPGIRVLMVGVVTFSSMCHVMVLICILLLLVKITEEKQIDQNF